MTNDVIFNKIKKMKALEKQKTYKMSLVHNAKSVISLN